MSRDISWIDAPPPGRLAILSRPRAGEWLEDQLAGWRAAGIGTVVSLLDAEEVRELDLGAVPALCARHAITYLSFPIADRGVPSSRNEAIDCARRLAAEVAAGRTVAVHCRAGIGRSSLMAAAILVLLGREPSGALDLIATSRGVPVPDTDEQRDWVQQMTVR
jgi:protein-tyrosine phosphatase